MQTLNSELRALEAALGRQRNPGELVAEVEERQRQALGFNPAALPGPGSPVPDVPVVRSRGATLIAISADTPDGSLTWHELTYDVLADPNHTIARQLGIMATPPTNDADTKPGVQL